MTILPLQAICALTLLAVAGQTPAQNFPSKPLRIIVPAIAGSAPDVRVRQIAPKLAEALGQHVIVDNRPGANGRIAAQQAAMAQADGHTLMSALINNAINDVLKLKYVVITSVDRDDLRDGGAAHFKACIREVRARSPQTRIEVLVPDFRGRLDIALDILSECPPDVMNHNLETVPRLYKQARPGADYNNSLMLLKKFKARFPHIPAKSGLMVGLGETDDEILQVMRDLRAHDVDMLTIGQYLQPSLHHLPVLRYVGPSVFDMYAAKATEMGFIHAASGPLVRSSYHADQQAHDAGVA